MTQPSPNKPASPYRGLPRAGWWLVIALAVVLAAGLIRQLGQAAATARIVRADPDAIARDGRLLPIALARGGRVFERACAGCHGSDAKGADGIPDLTDRDRLYGDGRVWEIEEIVRHGIRAGDRKGRNLASMPAYASPRPYARYTLRPLRPDQIEDATQFLLSLTHRATDRGAADRGRTLFADKGGCYDCHLRDAGGDTAIGAPNLTDRVWLYGGGHDAIYRSIGQGRAGVSPAFAGTLSAADQRAVAFYVALARTGRAGDIVSADGARATPVGHWRLRDPGARRSLLLAGVGAIVGLLAAGVGLFTAHGTRTSGVPAEDVAIVNGVPILRVDYDAQIRSLYDKGPAAATEAERRRAIDDMIREELSVQRGLELGMASDDIDVRAALVRGTEAQTATDATTTKASDAELHAWYGGHRSRYASEGTLDLADYRLAPAQRPRAAALAAALRDGASPTALGLASAGTFDDGAQFYFIARLRLGDRLYALVRRLPDGGVTEPVERPDGAHIIRLIHDTKPVPDTFEESRSKIVEDWTADKVQRLTSANDRFLRRRADIRIARDLQ